jgi:hypothetical protein
VVSGVAAPSAAQPPLLGMTVAASDGPLRDPMLLSQAQAVVPRAAPSRTAQSPRSWGCIHPCMSCNAAGGGCTMILTSLLSP